MKPRHILAIVIGVIALIGLIFGTCGAIVLFSLTHAGPKHVFPLAGDGPLTDDQALDLSKQVMVLDGKSAPMLRPTSFGSKAAGTETYVNRQPNSTDVSIYWYEPLSGKSTTVVLQRKNGEVVGRTQN